MTEKRKSKRDYWRVRLQHRVEYWFMRGACWLAAGLGFDRAMAAGRLLAHAAYHLAPNIRKITTRNIRETVGRGESPDEITRIVRGAYVQMGYSLMEFLGAPVFSSRIWRGMEVEGKEHLDQALAQGRGAIIVTGHMSNWELLGAYLGMAGYPLHVIYKHLANPLTESIIVQTRHALKIGLVSNKEWREGSQRVLSAGEVLGIVSDQDAGKHGIFVEFLGKPASTFVGPAVIALRHQAPLLPTYLVRVKPGHWRVVILPPLELARTEDFEADVAALTIAWVKCLERAVRETPEQYFWFHRRWKTQPDIAAVATAARDSAITAEQSAVNP